ncbi:MAG: glycosyltransferase family 2 protein [Elusimicrobia bacterium]|nr:glycosyltransferase family 2 protein [Elusimicrobiota bacterium]
MNNNTKNHHFTVVIPTRERCDTLEHALHACVIQDYDNLEILVSDNFSQDRTREVVESFKDSRIRYINTGKRLSMTDNFEFALSHVPPKGYVIYIGDDDGLLPNAIRAINAVIVETGTQVLRWDLATYAWPNAENTYANRLIIPSVDSGTTIRNSADTIQNVLSFQENFMSLPMMYLNSAIEYGVIKRIKDSSGRFYHSMTPDVYSGFAIAGTVVNFINSSRPYVIVGISHHSNGQSASGLSLTGPAKIFLAEDNLPFHPNLVFCFSMDQVVIECYLQARDHLPLPWGFRVDMEKMIFLMMKDAAPKSQDLYMSIKNAVLQLGQIHNIPDAAQRAIAINPMRKPGSGREPTFRNFGRAGFHLTRLLIEHLRRGTVYIDCSSLNVKNIYDASLLCGHILRHKDMSILGYSVVLRSALANINRHLFHKQSSLWRQASMEALAWQTTH